MVSFENLLTIGGFALLDSVNPSAIIVTLYAVLTLTNYTSRVLAYIFAIFLTYLALGVFLSLGIGGLFTTFSSTLTEGDKFFSRDPADVISYGVQGVLGVGLFLYAVIAPWRKKPAKDKTQRLPSSTTGIAGMMALGGIITLIEFATAIPYLGAITVMSSSDTSAPIRGLILLGYNIIFVLPPLVVLAIFRMFRHRLRPRFQKWLEKLQKGAGSARYYLAGVLGFLLLRNAIGFFAIYFGGH